MSPMTRVDIAEHHQRSEHDSDEPDEDIHHMGSMVSAPPSRPDYGSAYGDSSVREGSITLSAAERDHAKASGVSEEEYAKQKLKMMKAKKSGLIKD